MKRFPRDCDKDCGHYSEYDMSIDDYVGCCDLLKMQCDLCDEDYSYTQCPLTKEISPEKPKRSGFDVVEKVNQLYKDFTRKLHN